MNKKAQNFTEYAVLIGIVSLALFSMQVYFKRGIQSVAKLGFDDLGSVAEKDYALGHNNETISAQLLGVMEQGVVDYNVSGQKMTTDKVIHVVDNSAGSFSRATEIESDVVHSEGTYNMTVRIENSEDFTLKDGILDGKHVKKNPANPK